MTHLLFRRHFSRNILIRLVLLAFVAAALVYWQSDYLNEVYFRNQLTGVGLIINGAILALFLLGMIKIVLSLLHYRREEQALTRFLHNLDHHGDPLKDLPRDALIAQRYLTMEQINRSNTPIHHGALASTLVAAESTRTSFPKFINNILILTGVFGTIVSLSIALIGASDVLENAVDVSGMGMVIHGMSTALSTTITAILCYLFFGYFYLKLSDVQTNVLSGIEQVTSSHLMPRFQIESDNILYEFSGLIRSMQTLVQHMEVAQKNFLGVEKRLLETLMSYRDSAGGYRDELGEIKKLLRQGFRLPELEND